MCYPLPLDGVFAMPAWRLSPLSAALAVCVVLASAVPSEAAPPPSEQILPAQTVAWIRIPDLRQSRTQAAATQIGEFLADPAMQPFAKHLEQRILDRWTAAGNQQVSLEEILDLPTGEVAIAITRTDRGRSVLNGLFDVTGHETEVDGWMDRIGERLVNQGAERKRWGLGDVTLVQYTLPEVQEPAEERRFGLAPPRQLWHFRKDGMLVVSTDQATAVWLVKNWENPEGKLATQTAFVQVRQRLAAAGQVNGLKHDLEAVIDPFGYFATQRADFPRDRRARAEEVDPFVMLRDEGFDAIKAIGMTVDLARGDLDSHVRMAAYAPLVPDVGGVAVLSFPNGPFTPPPAWIPQDLSGMYRLNWDRKKAYTGFGALFDGLLQQPGAFADVVTSMQNDPNGPMLNLYDDLVTLLDDKATIVSYTRQPIDLTSRQSLLAIAASQPEKLAANMAAGVRDDPNVKTRVWEGHTIWEFYDDPKRRRDVGRKEPIPPWLACVAHGHLFVATQPDVLYRVLSADPAAPPQLTASQDYLRVQAELNALGNPPSFVRGFLRLSDSYRVTYELTRRGQLRQEQTLAGFMLRELSGDNAQADKQLQGNLLPEYEKVAGYFGPGGLQGIVEPGFGWYGEIIVLPPKKP